jgi:hypothetical protein
VCRHNAGIYGTGDFAGVISPTISTSLDVCIKGSVTVKEKTGYVNKGYVNKDSSDGNRLPKASNESENPWPNEMSRNKYFCKKDRGPGTEVYVDRPSPYLE